MTNARQGRETRAEEAVNLIEPSDTVIVGHLEPQTVIEEICRQRQRLRGLNLVVWPRSPGPQYLEPGIADHFNVFSLTAALVGHSGGAHYLPTHVSRMSTSWPFLVSDAVVLLHVGRTPSPDRLSMGVCADYSYDFAVRNARLVIAEANSRMPVPYNGLEFPTTTADVVVSSDQPVATTASTIDRSEPRDAAIAEHVAHLVNDFDTVEIGVGSLGSAIWRGLANKRGLGIHTGSINRDALELIDSGVVTNERKSIDTGYSVTAMITGDEKTLRRGADHPALLFRPTSYTHATAVLGRIDNMVAINSALQVDLFGQVYSETVGARGLGAIGGQADFMRGSAAASNGRNIIAIRSTVASGRSRIGAPHGRSPVTVAGHDVDFVVTEFGVADLRFKTLHDRAAALIAVAHPDVREELSHEADLTLPTP